MSCGLFVQGTNSFWVQRSARETVATNEKKENKDVKQLSTWHVELFVARRQVAVVGLCVHLLSCFPMGLEQTLVRVAFWFQVNLLLLRGTSPSYLCSGHGPCETWTDCRSRFVSSLPWSLVVLHFNDVVCIFSGWLGIMPHPFVKKWGWAVRWAIHLTLDLNSTLSFAEVVSGRLSTDLFTKQTLRLWFQLLPEFFSLHQGSWLWKLQFLRMLVTRQTRSWGWCSSGKNGMQQIRLGSSI